MLSEYAEEEAVKHQESACLRMQRQNSSTVRSCQCGRTDVLSILEKCINTQTGTDGRLIILKKTSVTSRHKKSVLLFSSYALLLFLAACSITGVPSNTHTSGGPLCDPGEMIPSMYAPG